MNKTNLAYLTMAVFIILFCSHCRQDSGSSKKTQKLNTAQEINQGACGGVKNAFDKAASQYQEEILLVYDGQKMGFTHKNAQVGCGQKVKVEYEIVGKEIQIYEKLLEEPPFCGSCCYQLQYSLAGIEPDKYGLKISGIDYAGQEDGLVSEIIDLSNTTDFTFYVRDAVCN